MISNIITIMTQFIKILNIHVYARVCESLYTRLPLIREQIFIYDSTSVYCGWVALTSHTSRKKVVLIYILWFYILLHTMIQRDKWYWHRLTTTVIIFSRGKLLVWFFLILRLDKPWRQSTDALEIEREEVLSQHKRLFVWNNRPETRMS